MQAPLKEVWHSLHARKAAAGAPLRAGGAGTAGLQRGPPGADAGPQCWPRGRAHTWPSLLGQASPATPSSCAHANLTTVSKLSRSQSCSPALAIIHASCKPEILADYWLQVLVVMDIDTLTIHSSCNIASLPQPGAAPPADDIRLPAPVLQQQWLRMTGCPAQAVWQGRLCLAGAHQPECHGGSAHP